MHDDSRADSEELVYECIATHNEMVLVQLIDTLRREYDDLAKLSTFGEYKTSWTHEDVLNYVTYHT